MPIHFELLCLELHQSIVGSVVECSPATRAARVRFPDDAVIFSRIFFPLTAFTSQTIWYPKEEKLERKKIGDGGYRSPYLSHAKRALYHLSYVPCLHLPCINCLIVPQLSSQSEMYQTFCQPALSTFDSSVGRAVDCSCDGIRYP